MAKTARLLVLLAAGCAGAPRLPAPPSVVAKVRATAPAATEHSAARQETKPVERPPLDPRASRFLRFARVWGAVRYLQPRVVAGQIDWDAPFVASIDGALAARSDEEEAAAVQAMLRALGDPASTVEEPSVPSPPPAESPEVRTMDGVTVVPVVVSSWAEVPAVTRRLRAAIAKATQVVVDLRTTPRESAWLATQVVSSLADVLTAREVTGVTWRTAEHRGYAPQVGFTSGGYASSLVTRLPMAYAAATGPHPARVVFLARQIATLPDLAWAMQLGGGASIVVHGATHASPGATEALPLPGGRVARVRVAEPADATLRADLELDMTATDDAALLAAVRLASSKTARKPRLPTATSASPAFRHDKTYADAPFPPRELRLLSLARVYEIIRRFDPYAASFESAWERAIAEALPLFEAASDAAEYARAVAELATSIPDGHVSVHDPHDAGAEAAQLPLRVQMIEGRPIVTAIELGRDTRDAGVAVGDEIVEIDGERIEDRMERLSKTTPASNGAWLLYRLANRALAGPADSIAELVVRSARGVETRRLARGNKRTLRSGPVYRVLDGGIGYVDLDRLETAEVDAMFAALEATRAIVFDMRGYPHGTAWKIAPRLNTKGAKHGAQFFEPLVGGDNAPGARVFFAQELNVSDKPLYRGKTVMLVDERTMSQAEHTGLFFEAANGTTFIGSQTAGANGDITSLTLPGGLVVRFSAHDVRHADGRTLQGIGLVPDIAVRPTLRGVREGRDEVLERALEFLRSGR